MLIREMYKACAFEKITVNTTVQSLTATNIDPINGGQVIGALMTVDAADVRVTWDGTTVVAGSTGHLLSDGSSLELWETNNLANFRAVRNGSTNANLQVTYYQA